MALAIKTVGAVAKGALGLAGKAEVASKKVVGKFFNSTADEVTEAIGEVGTRTGKRKDMVDEFVDNTIDRQKKNREIYNNKMREARREKYGDVSDEAINRRAEAANRAKRDPFGYDTEVKGDGYKPPSDQYNPNYVESSSGDGFNMNDGDVTANPLVVYGSNTGEQDIAEEIASNGFMGQMVDFAKEHKVATAVAVGAAGIGLGAALSSDDDEYY